jgi:uncharacterized protein (UPF0276 family)
VSKHSSPADRSSLGFGLGLRTTHYEAILDEAPPVDWFEILSENYMVEGGKPLHFLDRIRADYPVVMHGVSLSIGSTAPLDFDYLARLKGLAQRVEPAWISDHLCWTGVAGQNMHDLLPVPYTQEAITHIADRVQQVQDYLGRGVTARCKSGNFSRPLRSRPTVCCCWTSTMFTSAVRIMVLTPWRILPGYRLNGSGNFTWPDTVTTVN